MSKLNNEVLTAVILMERIIPRLHANSRETIKRSSLKQIEQSLTMVLRSLTDNCTNPLVLTPIMEVVELIDEVVTEPSFVETANETKQLIVDRLTTALDNLYVFAGKFYIENEFDFNIGKMDVLRNIVDTCINSGFYFGYDVKLRQEGII